ncbi:hypothetical protein HH299_12290, partial [Xanthomonas sp. Kuri4-2]
MLLERTKKKGADRSAPLPHGGRPVVAVRSAPPAAVPIRVLSVAESSDGSASGEVEAALADTVSVPSAGRGR